MAAAGRYRVPVFPRLTPLLAETTVDAVLVATANGDKAAAIEEALRAGKHVIAHAPLAVSVAQFDAVAQVQAASGAGLLSLHPLRFTPAYVRLRELTAAGQFGAISQIVIINSQKVAATPRTQAFYDSPTHGGILTSLAVHDIDVLRRLGGDLTVTESVTQCHGVTDYPNFEDAGVVRCTFARGGEGVVVCNWLALEAGEPFQELTFIGTEGTAWISGGKLRAMSEGLGSRLPVAMENHVFVVTQSDPGGAAPVEATDQNAYDAVGSMLDDALATLGGDAVVREEATADALQTARAAVQAQDAARQNRE